MRGRSCRRILWTRSKISTIDEKWSLHIRSYRKGVTAFQCAWCVPTSPLMSKMSFPFAADADDRFGNGKIFAVIFGIEAFDVWHWKCLTFELLFGNKSIHS